MVSPDIIKLIISYLNCAQMLNYFKTLNLDCTIKFPYRTNYYLRISTIHILTLFFPNITITHTHLTHPHEIFNCLNLIHLTLTHYKHHDLTPLTKYKNLRFLKITSIHDTSLTSLLGIPKSLHTLKINNAKNLDISEIQYISNLTSLTLYIQSHLNITPIQYCTHLKKIIINRYDLADTFIFAHCQQLKYIKLINAYNLTQIDFKACHNLRHITFICCSKLLDISPLHLNNKLQQLKMQSCFYIKTLTLSSDSLQFLKIHDCPQLKPNSITTLICPNLRKLQITQSINLSDIDFLHKFTHLTSITLSQCHFKHMIYPPRLHTIILHNCYNLITLSCHNLTHIKLYACNSITNLSFLSTSPFLTKLECIKCYKLTNISSSICPSLQYVHFQECDELVDISPLQCPNLYTLILYICPKLVSSISPPPPPIKKTSS